MSAEQHQLAALCVEARTAITRARALAEQGAWPTSIAEMMRIVRLLDEIGRAASAIKMTLHVAIETDAFTSAPRREL